MTKAVVVPTPDMEPQRVQSEGAGRIQAPGWRLLRLPHIDQHLYVFCGPSVPIHSIATQHLEGRSGVGGPGHCGWDVFAWVIDGVGNLADGGCGNEKRTNFPWSLGQIDRWSL